MAKVCALTGKKVVYGNARSHACNATRRNWGANLHKVKVEVDGKVQRVYLSARALRTLKKTNA